MALVKNGTLKLSDLGNGLTGVTPAFGRTLAEACAVCFEDQTHESGIELSVDGTFLAKYKVLWQGVTEQMLNCYNDEEFTTELGAYAVAILLAIDLTEYTVIKRSRRGTGFDYWLGKEDDQQLPFQGKERLEVSGIRNGDISQIRSRIKEKINQVKPSNYTHLPAIIIVVEFSTPLSKVIRNE